MHNRKVSEVEDAIITHHYGANIVQSGIPAGTLYSIVCSNLQCSFNFYVHHTTFIVAGFDESFYCPNCGFYNTRESDDSNNSMRPSTIRDDMRGQTTDRPDATSGDTNITDIGAAIERSKSRHPGNQHSIYYASYRGYLRALHDVSDAIAKLTTSHRNRFDPWD